MFSLPRPRISDAGPGYNSSTVLCGLTSAPMLAAPWLALDLLQAVGHVLQCGLPIHLAPFAILLEHGLGQALVAVQGFVGEAVAVGDPALVDVFVLERHDAHHLVVLDLDDQVGTGGVVRADRLLRRDSSQVRAL
jgi:hypothetical protein